MIGQEILWTRKISSIVHVRKNQQKHNKRKEREVRIAEIKIRNFRKFKEVAIDLRDKTTVFIGANNSGKTSALVAIRYFLNQDDNQKIKIYDFTLSNHAKIKEIGRKLENETQDTAVKRDISLWNDILPSLDLWLDVGDDDIHYVSHILPTLDWEGGSLGVRLQYEPKDISNLYSEYKEARSRSEELKSKVQSKDASDLFQKDMLDFLEQNLQKHFSVKFYGLDPAKKDAKQESIGEPIEGNPLIGLIRIDEINAQRGLDDVVSAKPQTRLTQQFKKYYNAHIDSAEAPAEEDVEALEAIHRAQKIFTATMQQGFKPALDGISNLGYPGFYNPTITINPQLKPTDGLDHDSALQYKLDGCKDSFLPEDYNGLGFQNLIFIAFKLIQFRDAWLKFGKQKTTLPSGTNIEYPPIHLVLVEEPEAHLHPQVQQVFIKQAHNILTSRPEIKNGKLTTQLVITTHSSHVIHECEFADLRYFKRVQPADGEVQSSNVVDLSNVFGDDEKTEKFVTRYIKLTHCDLFFADAAILIEGDAERILLPHFIRKWNYLNQSYISLLSIGGSHAHRLKPLMETLEIPTLIITDLDAVETDGKSAHVMCGANQKTNNHTLKSWFPKKESIDDLLGLQSNDKTQDEPFALRVAYPKTITCKDKEVLPYTFEDSLIFENKEIIDAAKDATGMLKKAQNIGDALSAFKKIRKSDFKKAEFALDLLCFSNFDDVKEPSYISDGLQWLENILQPKLGHVPTAKENEEDSDAK